MTLFLVLIASLFAALGISAVITQFRGSAIEAAHPPLGDTRSIDGVRLHYVDHQPPRWQPGDPTLVFVHGASANLRDPHMAFFEALKDRYRMVFVDRPGHGYSQRGTGAAHKPARQASLIIALLRSLDVETTIAVGHSWGGSVVAQMGLNAPDTVAGLVFIAPATHPWPGGVSWYYELAARPVIGPVFTHAIVPPVAAVIAPTAISNVFLPEQSPPRYAERLGVPLLLRPGSFQANARDVALLKPEVTKAAPSYARITQPAAVITGDEDSVVLAEIHSAGLVRDLPNAWRVDLQGAGHMPHHTRTAAVIAEIDTVARKLWGSCHLTRGAAEECR